MALKQAHPAWTTTQDFAILDQCHCPEKTQGLFCDPTSMLKARVLFESTPDNQKENQTLPVSLRLQPEYRSYGLQKPMDSGARRSRTLSLHHLSVQTEFILRARKAAERGMDD